MNNKEKIVNLFLTNVIGRKPDLSGYKESHDGKVGHWLEKQMGVKPNSDNKPDLHGYEMKNHTTSKTTFGDWSASSYIFGKNSDISLDQFYEYFGKKNEDNRLSWCASAPKKINQYSSCGQVMIIEDTGISIIYDYSYDQRSDKATCVPIDYQHGKIKLAWWSHEKLETHVTNKFDQRGWFKCLRGKDGTYKEIIFGYPLNYQKFLELLKAHSIFFDTGMYKGNNRKYSMWRSNNSVFNSLAYEKYKSIIPEAI